MKLLELLNKLIELIEETPEVNFGIHAKSWLRQNKMIFVSHENIQTFNIFLEEIYCLNENIYTKFTRQKIYKFIEDEIVKVKRNKNRSIYRKTI